MTLERDPATRIRTPDQRLRVFVSSTLRELEAERRAARAAIERLRLAPVMFELGARPHPPRDLYRAYLEQSDVFVGIYGESYGWVAPGEEISGLEDEYRLAPRDMPKLIYLLADARREPRLDAMIARIQSDDRASYKRYTSATELAELLEADLATLLAERFDSSRSGAQPGSAEPAVTHPAPVPVAFSRLIGRAEEVTEISTLLQDPDIRLVTLVGPGGVGKSRLSIEVAESCRTAFTDGTVFIALENVLEPELLFPTIADALGIRDTGEAPITQRLAIALESRRMLMILDNFEQLATAAPLLVDLYSLAPHTTFLVTSRVVMRVRGERVYEVAPLVATDPEAPDSVARAARSPAVELFVERGRAVKPDFDLEQTNAAAVVRICQALDGIPLAIELAAARLRVLTPAAILARLDRRLQLLVDSSRDLPDRQRTLRATIEWSTDLLGPRERGMLLDLGVFSPGFTLEAIDAIGGGRSWAGFALDCLAQLIDSSLVSQSDQEGVPVFSLLATVREYAAERLAAAGDERKVRDAHAAYYTDLASRVAADLRGPGQREAARRLDLERGNARGAIRHLIAVGDGDAATAIAWRLYLYWWMRGYFYELHLWMRELREGDHALTPHARAVATFYVLWTEMWRAESAGVVIGLSALIDDFADVGDPLGVAMARAATGLARASLREPDIPQAIGELTTAATEFESLGHTWGQVLSLVGLGRVAWMLGETEDASRRFSVACDAARHGDPFTLSVAIHHVACVRLFAHDVEGALRLFAESMDISLSLDHNEGIAYAVVGIGTIAALRGDLERAGLLAGSAERILGRAGLLAGSAERVGQRVTMFDAEAFVFHTRHLREAAAGLDATAAAEVAIARGRELSVRESVECAHQVVSGP